MLSVGDQVQVIGELNGAGEFLQDVYTEALTAEFSVWFRVTCNPVTKKQEIQLKQ